MRRWIATFVIAAALGVPASARARREATFGFPFSRVWTTAVRLLRVDLECPITEKDRDEGYFLFDYPDHGKTFPGSVEFVATKADGVEQVRVVVQVPAMPSYLEGMILDRLERKLKEELGETPAGAKPSAKAAPPKSG